MAWRPVLGADAVMGSPAVATQALVEHIHQLLAELEGALQRAGGNERPVHDHRGAPPEIAVILTVRSHGVTQQVFQRIGRRSSPFKVLQNILYNITIFG